jgi:hypothetical protein
LLVHQSQPAAATDDLGAFARASVQRKSWANYGLLRNCSQSDHTAG